MEIANKYGLTRSALTADIKRQIRRASGYGCVICGLGLYQYEHVEPTFAEATEHDPTKMTLLCSNCHGRVTTKSWSKQKVKDAMANPFCLQKGFSRDIFEIGNGHPYLNVCGNKFIEEQVPIKIKGRPLFRILPAENPGEPFRLNGFFTDSKEKVSLEIFENEWRAKTSNWDVNITGGAVTIREGMGKVHLILQADPPNGLIVKKLNMKLDGYSLIGDERKIAIEKNGRNVVTLGGGIFSGNGGAGLNLG